MSIDLEYLRNRNVPGLSIKAQIRCQDDTGQWRDPNNTLTWKFKGEWTGGSNILGLVFFAIILGVALANIGEKARFVIRIATKIWFKFLFGGGRK